MTEINIQLKESADHAYLDVTAIFMDTATILESFTHSNREDANKSLDAFQKAAEKIKI